MKVVVVNARTDDTVGAGYILESALQTRPHGEMTAKLELWRNAVRCHCVGMNG